MMNLRFTFYIQINGYTMKPENFKIEVKRNDRIYRQRYESILAAAEHLFLLKSVAQVSINDIAENIGMKRRSLYRYFPTKSAIAYPIFRKFLGELCDIQLYELYQNDTGLNLIRNALLSLNKYAKSNRDKILFTAQFDHYFSITFPSKTDYTGDAQETAAIKNKNAELITAYLKCIKKGISDRSIKKEIKNPRNLVVTAINSWFALAQRISVYSSVIIAEGYSKNPENMIRVYTEMIMRSFV